MYPPYPGSVARARERAQALEAYFQHPPGNSQGLHTPVIPTTQRSNGHMNMAQGEQLPRHLSRPAASTSSHQVHQQEEILQKLKTRC